MEEKLFTAFQVLRTVAMVHESRIVHGDIKPENFMITSWGWLFLVDFAHYKPARLPTVCGLRWRASDVLRTTPPSCRTFSRTTLTSSATLRPSDSLWGGCGRRG